MNQKPNSRTILWGLLLITLIVAIIYTKSITLTSIYNWYTETRDFVISSKDFQFWATIFTLSGVGVFGFFTLFSRLWKPKSPPIEPEKTKSEPSVKLDWGNFAMSQQPIMSVTASHISIEGRSAIKVTSVPIQRQWERPTDRDRLNRQGEAVGRKQELSELWERLNHDAQPVVAVVGMPGLGKSTVASMFIHEYGDKYAGGQLWTEIGYEFRSEQCQAILNYWASWAYGGDLHRLQQDEQWQKLQFEPAAVKELLSKHGPMLVVLDDVWDLDAIQPLREALPAETVLLVTTRDERIAKRLTGEMLLKVLNPEDALALLQKFLPLMADEQLKLLAHGLGYHAQALTIAGGDIQARDKHRHQKAIQDLLQRVEKGQGFGDLPQLDQHDRQNEVEIAFRFSYDDIKNKMGADYQQRLRLLGAFGPLEADFSTEAAAALWQDDLEQASDFLDVLQGRSLLIRREEEERWGQHPLLRAYSRALLKRSQEWDMAKQRYMDYVIDFAKKGFQHPPQEWANLKPDFPHLYYVGDELFQQLSSKLGNLETLAQPEATALPAIDELDELTKQQLTMASQFSSNTAGYVINRPEIGERGFNWLWMGLAAARLIEEQPETIVGFILVLGNWYGYRGKPSVALAYFEQALVISRQNELKDSEAELLNQIGMIYYATSQYEPALKFLNESLAIKQEIGERDGEATVLQNIGGVYQTLSQNEKALEFLKQALPIFQDVGNRNVEATVLQNIGMVYQALSQNEKALEFLNQALSIFQEVGNRNGEATVLQNIGGTYQALSQNEKALEFLNQALPILQEVGNRDGEATVLQNLGSLMYQRLNQNEKAFEFLEQALLIMREVGNRYGEGMVLQNFGGVYRAFGQHKQALEYFMQSLVIMQEINHPLEMRNNYFWCGQANYNLGNNTNALDDFSHAIELQPDNADNHFWRGKINYTLGNNTDALDDLTRAIELQPNNWLHYHWRGTTYFATQDYTKALADLTRAIELQPANSLNFYWRGLTYYELEDYSESLADFNRAIELQPDNAINHFWRGKVNNTLGNNADAIVDFTRTIELQPENEYNYLWRGATYFATQDYPKALADLTRAIELQPENSWNFYWRGRTHYELEDYSESFADFNRAVELQPDDADYSKWQSLVRKQLGKQ